MLAASKRPVEHGIGIDTIGDAEQVTLGSNNRNRRQRGETIRQTTCIDRIIYDLGIHIVVGNKAPSGWQSFAVLSKDILKEQKRLRIDGTVVTRQDRLCANVVVESIASGLVYTAPLSLAGSLPSVV